jgi:hypothetical protein
LAAYFRRMKNRRFAATSCLLLLALAGCDSSAQRSEKLKTTAAGPVAAPQGATLARPAAFRGYRRYRGTVGSLPVNVELDITVAGDSTSYQGSYFYERNGGVLWLAGHKTPPGQRGLLLIETVDAGPFSDSPGRVTARWQANEPAGPVLTGTWTSADGSRQLPFALREDYTGAVRYELLLESQKGGPCRIADEPDAPEHTLQAMRQYLHLLGPDTLQPGLRALQCPPPARRRAELREELVTLSCDPDNERYGTDTDLEIMYNGNGLLSLLQTDSEDLGGAHPLGDNEAVTYDLTTGRACDVRTWLRPDKARAVAQLFDHYLRADSIGQGYAPDVSPSTKLKLSELPNFGLNSEGLFCTLGNLGAPHVVQRLPITIPFAAVQPYVLPGTPLARLLQARGLGRKR